MDHPFAFNPVVYRDRTQMTGVPQLLVKNTTRHLTIAIQVFSDYSRFLQACAGMLPSSWYSCFLSHPSLPMFVMVTLGYCTAFCEILPTISFTTGIITTCTKPCNKWFLVQNLCSLHVVNYLR